MDNEEFSIYIFNKYFWISIDLISKKTLMKKLRHDPFQANGVERLTLNRISQSIITIMVSFYEGKVQNP